MAPDANIRASDADRDRVAAALREHLAAGRLTTVEFDERLDQAFAAKTLGDLDSLMADLPRTDLDRFPGEQPPARRPAPGQVEGGPDWHSPAPWRTFWRPWLAITGFFFLLWLLSGAGGGPWFLWIALLAGGVLLLRRARGGQHGPHRQDRHRGP